MSDDNEPNEWSDALLELMDKRDGAPLARLLRSDAPMPLAARDVLANLLEPPKPNLMHRRLILQADRKGGSIAKDLKMLADARAYLDHIRYGLPAQVAAEEAAEERNLSDRTVFRRLTQYREWRAELERIIFGEEPELGDDGVRQRKSRGKPGRSGQKAKMRGPRY